MSCWKSKHRRHRRPSLSLKQSSNLSSRFRGSSALVMGRDKDSNVAHRFTDENLLHRTQLIWWQYVTVSWGPFRKLQWLSEYGNQKDLCHPLSDLCRWNKHSAQAALLGSSKGPCHCLALSDLGRTASWSQSMDHACRSRQGAHP